MPIGVLGQDNMCFYGEASSVGMGPTNAPHSFQVLRVAHAPSPLLSLAQARAVFFERALRHGPPILLHLLHVQWKETAATSWLQQFAVDIQAVAVYVPAVRLLTDQPCPVEALCEVLQQEPRWWKAQIRAAIQAYHKELEVWYSQPPPAGADLAPSNMPRPFVCPHCQASFELRKHLRVHLARSHGYLSPVRHFVTGPYCGACMRWYHTTARVHNHLRHSKACLMRLLHTMRPLRNEEIREVEAQDASTRRKVHKGTWRAYQASLPHVPFHGPRMPTYTEAISGLDEGDLDLARIARLHRPHPRDVTWLEAYCSSASVEGPCKQSVDFWLTKPSMHPHRGTGSTDVSPLFCE